MKILAFSDMHGSTSALKEVRKKAKKADLIICCGDITIFGQKLDYFLGVLDSFGKPVLMIPGNHESDAELEELCERYDNVAFMQNRAFEGSFGGVDVIILGAEGNGFALTDKVFDQVAKAFEKVLKKERKGRKLVLMTHAPPYGTKLDHLLGDEHCGNKSIRSFIEKVSPDIAFSGHIHENRGKHDMVGKTLVINPGPFGEIVEI